MLRMVNEKKDDHRWYPFSVTIGLIEGYDTNAPRHTINEVKMLIGEWLSACKQQGLPELPGMVSEKTMLYTRRSDGELVEEPVAIFEGEVNALRISAEVSTEKLLSSLWGLASLVAMKLRQKRVYIKFNDRMIVLEDE